MKNEAKTKKRGRPRSKGGVGAELYPEARQVVVNLAWLAARDGVEDAELIRVFGKTRETFVLRKRNPWDFTLREICDLARMFGLSAVDLMTPPVIEKPGEKKERDV